MFTKRLLSLIALAAFAQAQSTTETETETTTETTESTEPVFVTPESCFASGQLIEANNASDKIAEETNREELFTSKFDHTMKLSAFTSCFDRSNRLLGAYTTLTSSPAMDKDMDKEMDGEMDMEMEPMVWEMPAIGITEGNAAVCTTLDIPQGVTLQSINVKYNASINQLIFRLSDGTVATKGKSRGGDREQNYEFNEDYQLIGLTGQLNNNRMSKFGVLVYTEACGAAAHEAWMEEINPTPKPKVPTDTTDMKEMDDDKKMEDDGMTMIIAIVAAVIALVAVGVIAACIMKRRKSKNTVQALSNDSNVTANMSVQKGAGPQSKTQRVADAEMAKRGMHTPNSMHTQVMSEDDTTSNVKDRQTTDTGLKLIDEKQVTIDGDKVGDV